MKKEKTKSEHKSQLEERTHMETHQPWRPICSKRKNSVPTSPLASICMCETKTWKRSRDESSALIGSSGAPVVPILDGCTTMRIEGGLASPPRKRCARISASDGRRAASPQSNHRMRCCASRFCSGVHCASLSENSTSRVWSGVQDHVASRVSSSTSTMSSLLMSCAKSVRPVHSSKSTTPSDQTSSEGCASSGVFARREA